MTERITDFYGRCIGTIETDGSGNKTVKDFYGRILGYYDRSSNCTKDFYNKVLFRGDMASALLIIIK